jgi:hypothetical protein
VPYQADVPHWVTPRNRQQSLTAFASDRELKKVSKINASMKFTLKNRVSIEVIWQAVIFGPVRLALP